MAPKNIAIFCDGTWQTLDQPVPTNVNRLARCVMPFDAAGVPQVVRYDDGVGVGTGILNEATQAIGGAFGEGLEDKVVQAYRFVCLNYEPGDAIFIFGFSRGAFTARSLAGLIHVAGILTRTHADKVADAEAIYRDPARAKPGPGQAIAEAYAAHFCDTYGHPFAAIAIAYVGVWDTVGELGIPTTLPIAMQVNQKFRFFDTSLSAFTRAARHAVAIDERRDTYKPTLWDNIDALNAAAGDGALDYAMRRYQQQWFAGHHSGVGGGQSDGGLSLLPLAWIAEGAARAGLHLDPAQLAAYADQANATVPFFVEPPNLGNFFVSHVGGESDRAGPTRLDTVSTAARTRWASVQTWRPKTLDSVAGALG